MMPEVNCFMVGQAVVLEIKDNENQVTFSMSREVVKVLQQKLELAQADMN